VSLGLFLGILIGYSLAIFSVKFKTVDEFVTPLIVFFQGVPKLILAPFLIILLGFGLLPKISLAVFMGFFAIYMGTLKGLRSVGSDILDVAKIYRMSDWQIMWKLRVPSSLPDFFSGVKISVPSVLNGIVMGEWVVGNVGLAYYVFASAMSFETAQSFAGLIVLSLIGVLLFRSVCYIEERFI
jgi:NitT/TauT family transport system permease protein